MASATAVRSEMGCGSGSGILWWRGYGVACEAVRLRSPVPS